MTSEPNTIALTSEERIAAVREAQPRKSLRMWHPPVKVKKKQEGKEFKDALKKEIKSLETNEG